MPRLSTLAILPLAVFLLSGPAQGSALGQEACPRASGPDAEAGWAAYADNDMTEARRRFEAALARCDDDQYARTGLGYVFLREGDPEEAEGLWTVVLDAEPENVDALVGMGLARWRTGDIDGVRRYFSAVLRLQPGHPTAAEYMERVDRADRSAAVSADRADRAWGEGNTALAMRLYSERLAANPGDETAILRVALMRAWQEEYDAALELLDRLIERQPGNVDARLARARVRAWSGDIPGAQAEVSEVLEVHPENREAMEALALFQTWAGQFDQAIESYEELLTIAPENTSAERQRAQALARAERYGASRSAYDALLARDPDDVEARLGLAWILAVSQDYAGAIQQYDQVLAHAPDETRALTGKARTMAWAGHLLESEWAALEAVVRDRASAAAWATLAQVYRWQGRDAAAQEALERAAELSPTDATIRDQIRSLNLALAPVARPRIIYEHDSDGNTMVTTFLAAGWHPTPRLEVRADLYLKQLDQSFAVGRLERSAQRVAVSGRYQVQPGWTFTGGLGASRVSGADASSSVEYQLGIWTPPRNRIGGALHLVSSGLNETAALAQVGVRSTQLSLSGRWAPAPDWRLDAAVSVGRFEGTEGNGRRSMSLVGSRRIGPSLSIGTSLRGFSFEKDLNDGYFDPDFYGIGEVTGRWEYRPTPWTVLVEVAPGIQQVRKGGDVTFSSRSNLRVAYGFGPGREVSLSFGYSSAGLMSFATGASGYRYTAFILGSSWVF